jgi:hypothetical protein
MPTIKTPASPCYGAEAVLDDLQRGAEPLTFSAAAREKMLRKDGRSPAISQIYRWHDSGIQGVRLEAARVAGSKITTRAAIARFIRRLSGSPETPTTAPATIGGAAEADKLLARAGL